MKTHSEIKKDAEDELRWDPDIDATDVAVAVHNGVVTLTGFVRSYMQKRQAERDVRRLAGGFGRGERSCVALALHQQAA